MKTYNLKNKNHSKPCDNEIVRGLDSTFQKFWYVEYRSDINCFFDIDSNKPYPIDRMHKWKREVV